MTRTRRTAPEGTARFLAVATYVPARPVPGGTVVLDTPAGYRLSVVDTSDGTAAPLISTFFEWPSFRVASAHHRLIEDGYMICGWATMDPERQMGWTRIGRGMWTAPAWLLDDKGLPVDAWPDEYEDELRAQHRVDSALPILADEDEELGCDCGAGGAGAAERPHSLDCSSRFPQSPAVDEDDGSCQTDGKSTAQTRQVHPTE